MKNRITKYIITLGDGSQAIYVMNKSDNSFLTLYDEHGKFIKNVPIKKEDFDTVLQLLEKSVIE